MKVLRFLVVIFVLLGFHLNAVTAAVFHEDLKEEIVFGKTIKFCEYKGLKLLPRSVFKDYGSCSKCSCKKDGLTCYTMYGLIIEPEDSKCTYRLVKCRVRWVLKSNNNKRCPRKWIPDQDSFIK